MLDVICAGWGRTGTLSLKTALEELGLPCYHMMDCIFKHKGHAQLWIDAADAVEAGKPVDALLRQLLAGYPAVIEWPAVHIWRQVLEQNPEAKVVLSVRDPAKWYVSLKESAREICKALHAAPWYVRRVQSLFTGGTLAMVDRLIWDEKGDLQGCFDDDPERAQQLFVQHIEAVKQAVPADWLLVFEVSQGWEPLCAFLGKPIPAKPFPHVNDRQEWQHRIAAVRRSNTMLTYAVPAAATAVLAAAVGLCMRHK